MSKNHYKLGENASLFWDPISRIKLVKNQVVEISPREAKKNAKIATAIRNSHIVPATEEDLRKMKGSNVEPVEDQDEEKTIHDMKVAELLTYLEENFELDENEMAEAKAMKKAELVAYIESLEEDEDE